MPDPFDSLRCDAFIPTQMDALQGLCLGEERGEVLDRRLAQANTPQVKVHEGRVVLDKVTQTGEQLLVFLAQRDVLHTLLDLLSSQHGCLVLQDLVPTDVEVDQLAVIPDNFQQLVEHARSHVLPAHVKVEEPLRNSHELAELAERALAVVHLDEGERSDLAPLDHQVEQLLDLHTVDLAVNQLQVAELVRDLLHEKRLEVRHGQRVYLVSLVDHRFEVLDARQTFQDSRKFVPRKAAIVEQNLVELPVVD